MQGVPQWLWNPVLDCATGAIGRATSLQEAVSLIAQLPACFNSALLPRVGIFCLPDVNMVPHILNLRRVQDSI